MTLTLKEQGFEGEYVCKPCKLIYLVYGDRCRCDICNRKLRFIHTKELRRLEERWLKKEELVKL